MFSILSLGVWFSVLFYTSVPCLLGIGKPIYTAQGNFIRLLTILIGIPVGFNMAGEFGAILAVSISDLPAYLAVQYGLFREKLVFLRQDIPATALLVVSFAILLAVRFSLGWGTPFDVLFS